MDCIKESSTKMFNIFILFKKTQTFSNIQVAVSTLSHDQMVDLLKTSMMVTVTVIPSHTDGSARRGCTQNNCLFSVGGEGDYENLASPDNGKVNRKTAALQTAVPGSHRRRLEMFVSMLYCSTSKHMLIMINHS